MLELLNTTRDELRHELAKLLVKNAWGISHLAKASMVSHITLCKFMNGDSDETVRLQSLMKLAKFVQDNK